MVRVCGFDLETTGLDFEKDEIVELAFVVKELGCPRPLHVESMYVYEDAYGTEVIPAEATEIHGITNAMVRESGVPLLRAFDRLCDRLRQFRVDYLVAHNGENFDKPFLLRKLSQRGIELDIATLPPWLDTRFDIDYPRRFRSHSLVHVCTELGFLNPFPHAALFDVMSMLKALDHFPIDAIIERSKSPWVTRRAVVSYDDREKAKARRYGWEKAGDKTYPKMWVKRVKACDLAQEKTDAPFEVRELGE